MNPKQKYININKNNYSMSSMTTCKSLNIFILIKYLLTVDALFIYKNIYLIIIFIFAFCFL
jgi:hypothetical protein